MTNDKQIHKILIKMTKEDILKEYLKANEKHMITPQRFIKIVIKRVIVAIIIVVILMWLYLLYRNESASAGEAIFKEILSLTVVFPFGSLILLMITDYDYKYISIHNLITKLKRYDTVCKIVNQEFVNTDKTVQELINNPHIHNVSKHLLWMYYAVNDRIDLMLDGNELMLYDSITASKYDTHLNFDVYPDGCYNLIFAAVDYDANADIHCSKYLCDYGFHLEPLVAHQIEQFDKRKGAYVYEVVHLSNWIVNLDGIGILIAAYEDDTPAVIRVAATPNDQCGEIHNVKSDEKWIRTTRYLTLEEWHNISYECPSPLLIMERIKRS